MTDIKQNPKPDAPAIDSFIGVIGFIGASYLIGKGIFDLFSKLNKNDDSCSPRYNAELEALRRIIREELL